MGDAEEAVLAAVTGAVLAPDVVDDVVAGAPAALGPGQSDRVRRDRLRELQNIKAEIERLTDAIEAGDNLCSLVGRLKQRQAAHDAIDVELNQLVERVKFAVFTDLSTAVERSGSAPGLGPSEWDEQWPTSVSGAASC